MTKFDVDEALVRKLAQLLAETGLSEIEYESDAQRIRVTRNAGSAGTPSVATAPTATTFAAPTPPAPGPAEGPPAGAVLSPMVGTAYAAPEPGAAAFVRIGDRVSKGQTLLVIEAMKVMNPIPAPHGGTVKEIHFTDGRPVEYGEILMIIA
jgi:acetyl-CoA carboxylase biotin carboxyl carrier protein